MNKRIKKVVLMMIAAVMMMAVLSACGEKEVSSEIVGTWKAAMVEASGISVDIAQYAEQMGQSVDTIKMEIVVKEDKTFSMDMMGQKSDGTWEERDGGYVLTAGGTDQEVAITDGKLVFDEPTMNIKVTFEK